MNREPSALLLLAAALLPAALGAPRPAEAQQRNRVAEPPPLFVERLDVNVVNVEVFVTDRDGHRVAGLTADDFELYEDGEPVEIANFYTVEWQDALMPGPPATPGQAAAVPAPRREPPPDQRLNLVVYVDHANIFPADRRRVLEELEGFLEDRLIEGDQVMLVSYHRTLEVVEPFTRDHSRIVRALGEMGRAAAYGPTKEAEYRRLLSSMQVFMATQDDTGIANAYQMIRSHVQQLQSDLRREAAALEKTVRALAGLPGRKALLFVSGGLPQRPGEELYQYLQDLASSILLTGAGQSVGGFDPSLEAVKEDQSHLFNAITRAANAHQVTLYTLDANGSDGRSSLSAAYSAEAGGVGNPGRTQLDALRTQNFQEPMIDMAEATGGASILNTSNFDDALTRMATDFDTYYSLGYNSPGAGDGEFHRIEVRVKRPGLKVRHRTGYVDKPRAERVADRTYSALLFDVESNPLGIQVDFGAPEHRGGKKWLLPVMVRIPLEQVTLLPNGEIEEGRLNIYLAVKDEKGGVSDLHQQPYPVKIPAEQIELARDQAMGYYATLEVHPGKPTLAIGVWDELSGTESFVQTQVLVGEEKQARRGR